MLNKSMTHPNQLTRFTGLLTIPLLAGAWVILTADLHAAEPNEAPQKSAASREIFGPEFDKATTGDKVQDANNALKFATVLAQGCQPVKNGEDKIILEIGTNNYPMAIPLVKVDGEWPFDTAAGTEEIISRHIGKDELNAIGFCRAYVIAQRQYGSANPGAGGAVKYAQKLKSTPGMKDGLYWPAAE